MIYTIILAQSAIDDILRLKKSGDKPTLIKLQKLLKELETHPETGTGKPEQLKGNLSGKWSRRISDKHRLVYEINSDTITVYILSAHGHYNHK